MSFLRIKIGVLSMVCRSRIKKTTRSASMERSLKEIGRNKFVTGKYAH